MTKKKNLLWLLLLLLPAAVLQLPACSKKISGGRPAVAEPSDASAGKGSFKTVGYLLVNRPELPGALAQIDFSRLTHLNLAFINPDSTGFFPDYPMIPPIVETAHKAGVKVLMSIGGGSIPVYYAGLLADDRRPAFVRALVAVSDKYRLDGIDVDLEGSAIDQHYTALVSELSVAMKTRKQLLTAAIATPYGANTPDEALAKYDFVNIMSYDKTGPWRPAEGGPHAPYEMAVSDLVYWGTTRGIAKDRMTLGLPFYGYGFGPGAQASSMNFKQIYAGWPAAAAADDQVPLPDGQTMYYNGIATIRKKTALAKEQAGGVMIWELLQDAPGDASLLKNISEVSR